VVILHSILILTLPSYFQLRKTSYMLCTSAPPPGTVNPNLEKATKTVSILKVMQWKLYALYVRSFLYKYYTFTHNWHKKWGHTTNRWAEIKLSVTKPFSRALTDCICSTNTVYHPQHLRSLLRPTSLSLSTVCAQIIPRSVHGTSVIIVNTSAIYRQKCKRACMQLKPGRKKQDFSGGNFVSQSFLISPYQRVVLNDVAVNFTYSWGKGGGDVAFLCFVSHLKFLFHRITLNT